MAISPASTVAEIATSLPATIRVFQQHGIEFCCGGGQPLGEVCREQGLSTETVLAELEAAVAGRSEGRDWREASLAALMEHIQARYHGPLREELPRLHAMLDKVVSRHGERFPDMLLPLKATFEQLEAELLPHMHAEDAVLFPAIADAEATGRLSTRLPFGSLEQPLAVFEADHAAAGDALQRMRALTGGYTPPPDACPTFRGLFHGLSELERDMHVHVHLENHILFPRAARL